MMLDTLHEAASQANMVSPRYCAVLVVFVSNVNGGGGGSGGGSTIGSSSSTLSLPAS